jgi:endonuclease/exonuclease/phosphatase (EEP) superfamily protein YafD
MRLRVLTFNTGLLRLLGRSVPAPFVPERFSALPDQIRNSGCDVILLQEIYGHSSRHQLAESLKDVLPFAIYPRSKRNFGLENGLMTLSRFPASGSVELFRDAPRDEALFDSKGLLVTEHHLSGQSVLTIVNLHTTAGGVFRHPEDHRTEAIRSRQINQVLDRASTLSSPLIIAGDLNAGPGVSECNFRHLMNSGYVSAHDLFHSESSDATWDPQNPLNSSGPHKACPPQRIDHIFIRNEDLRENRIKPLSSSICLREPVVPVGGGVVVSVSDHFGLCVDIDVSFEGHSSRASGIV